MLPLQEKRFELLCELDRICREQNIPYALFGNIALAAYNSDAFQPNDSYPLQIAMTSQPARQFASYMEQSCPQDRFFEYLGNNPRYGRMSMRYGNSNTLEFAPNFAQYRVNHGIYIEIVILRYKPLNKQMNTLERALETELEYTICRRPARPEVQAFSSAKNILRGIASAEQGKSLFERLTQEGPSRDMTRLSYKPFGRKKEYFPAYWFTHFSDVDFEDHTFKISSMADLYLRNRYGDQWGDKLPSYQPSDTELHIVDTDLPFAEYLARPGIAEKISEYGARRERLTTHQEVTAEMSAQNWKCFEIVQRSSIRYKLWEEYAPQKAEILSLVEQQNYAEAKKRLKHYLDELNVFYHKDLGLCFDPEIFDAVEACLVHDGRYKYAAALRELIPPEHLEPIDINLATYLKGEPKVVTEAQASDLEEIREFVARDISHGVYMYLDVHKYGLDNPDMKLWVQRSQNTNAITAVVMRYHDSMSIVASPSVVDFAFFEDLVAQVEPSMISGELELMKRIYPALAERYDMEEGYVYEITDYRDIDSDVGIEPAYRDDMAEAAALICSDESIGSYYDVDDLTQQLTERLANGTARNFMIRENGKIFAHIATYAEGEGIGVTAGLIVDPDHRDQPYGTFLESHLVKSMREDGLRAFTFVTNKKRARLFDAMGGVERSRYGKLTLKM